MARTHSLVTSLTNNAKKTSADFTSFGLQSITMEIWIKSSTNNLICFPMCLDYVSGVTFRLLNTGASGNYVWYTDADGGKSSPAVATTTAEDGAWHHFAGTYDGVKIRMYFDGTEVGTGTACTGDMPNASACPIGFGVRPGDSYGTGYVAHIGEALVWNTVRTQPQIAADMNTCSFTGAETGLTGWWKFDNSDADSQTNITANNLTSVNSPTFTAETLYSCSNIKSCSTNPKANIKSISTNAIANVKSVSTNA